MNPFILLSAAAAGGFYLLNVPLIAALAAGAGGIGWSFGRLSAEGIRQICSYVSPADAKPGDLIFFEKTYNTTGASHIGIYVGNNTMLHCGDPIQYTSISSDYWQSHFLQFGRLAPP